MLSINSNMNAHVLRKNLLNSIKETTEATERLSSGKRINSASDDPAVIGKISRLNSDIGSITEAIRNGSSAISLTQSAESGLIVINNLLSRVRELAVQGGNSTLTTGDRTSLQTEVDNYLNEIDNITKQTKHNDIKLLDGSIPKVQFIIGIDKDGRVEEHEHDVACLVKEWLAAVAPARIEEVDERGDIGEKHLDQNNDLRLCRPAEAQSEIAMHMQPGGACRAFAPLGQR